MKVLLITPPRLEFGNSCDPKGICIAEGGYPPLGLAYIAAVLEKENHKVKIIDSPVLEFKIEDIKKIIKRDLPDVVGIYSLTSDFPSVIKIAKVTKDIDKDIIVILGGSHLSQFPKESISFPFIDYAIQGEAEYSFPKFLEYLEKKKGIKKIEGLIWKNKKGVIINRPFPIIKDLNKLPWPARHLLPIKKYKMLLLDSPATTMVTSRGCPYNCAFCFKDEQNRLYRMRDPIDVVDEIEDLIFRFNIKNISIYDDCFPDKNHLIKICKEIINRKIDIKWETPNRIDLVNPEILRLMKDSGCIRIKYGIESASQKTLKLMRKNVTINQIKKVFRWTKIAGIENLAYVMVGNPYETEQDSQRTLELCKEIKADFVQFSITIPLPGTDYWKIAVKDFGADPDYWRKWTLGVEREKCPSFNNDAEKLCLKLYRKFYLRPTFIIKTGLSIRSLEQFKKYFGVAKAIIS